MQRFEGTLVGPEGTVLFADLRLRVGETTHRVAHVSPTLALRLDEGRTVRIEGLAQSLAKSERRRNVSLEGPFGELASEPAAALVLDHAPGDHVRVTLRGVLLRAGDRVTVEGEVLDTAFAEPSGLRDAAPEQPSTIRAVRVQFDGDASDGRSDVDEPERGDDARRAPPPRAAPTAPRPLATSGRVFLAIGLVLLVPALLASWLAPIVPERAWLSPLVALGLVTTLLGVERLARSVTHASYVTTVGGPRLTPYAPFAGYSVEPWLVAFGYGLWLPVIALECSPSNVQIAIAIGAVLPAIHLVRTLLHEHAFRRFAKLALALPRGTSARGRTTLVEAIVRSPHALRRGVEFIEQTDVRYSTDSSGHTHESQTTVVRDREHTSGASFTCSSGDTTLEVDPSGALVAFAKRTWRVLPPASKLHGAYDEALGAGDAVCIGARLEERDGALHARARGPESLLVFAGSLAALRRALLVARGRIAIGALLVAVPLALSGVLAPFAARFHTEGTVTSSDLPGVTTGDACSVALLAYHYGDAPRCTVSVRCNHGSLYGGFGMGQTECTFAPSPLEPSARASDATPFDGDLALDLSLPERTLTLRDEDGHAARVALEPAHPSPWF